MRRREFITLLGGAAAWPFDARAQQAALPIVALVILAARQVSANREAAFRRGLSELGYVEGQNIAIEQHWLDGQIQRLPSLMSELVRRRVAVIATPGFIAGAQAAKAATSAIPIVFGVTEDPVALGLVASLARPGGNATGMNYFSGEVAAKRLGLLHELVPAAVRVALLVNPSNPPNAETALRVVPEAAKAIGLQIVVLKASNNREIEAAFAALTSERIDALFVSNDGFFT